jgi:hypothetical protein
MPSERALGIVAARLREFIESGRNPAPAACVIALASCPADAALIRTARIRGRDIGG